MDELQQRWEAAWARKQELTAEQERLMANLAGMEPAMADRTMQVLYAQREELRQELLAIQAALQEREAEHGSQG